MELKRVEIVGFKSFAERIVVEFDQGITAIVGPNGSGKSNIADAIRWVLGEQSAKTLRGAKMEDVIFAGTARRKPLGYAEVVLVLDNRDRKMSVDYDEVAIRRRLFRSGESEYAINDGRCRLRDIQEMLMDTGIGKDGYSMIGQGQIDRLLSSKPQDRRLIFEEASGITKFKTRREQAEKELAEEQQQLVRVEDILTELNSREENLKNQAETAKTYLALKEELKLYEVSAFIGEYDQLKGQYDKVEAQMDALKTQIEASKEEELEAKRISEALSKESGEERARLQQMNEALRSMMLEREKTEGDLRVAESGREHREAEKASLSLRLEETGKRIADREKTLDSENRRLEEFDSKIENAQERLLDQKTAVRQALEESESLHTELAEARRTLSKAQQGLTELMVEAEHRQMRVQQDQQRKQGYEAEKTALEKDKAEALENKTLAEDSIRLLSGEAEALRAKEKESASRIESLDKAIGELKEQQENGLLQMKDLSRRVSWLNSMQQEYEGYSAPVKAVMKQKTIYGNKIRGTLSDIISVEKRYTTAIETLLGAALQNIVVEDTQTAKKLVEYLRKNDVGRATFLPVDAVIGRGRVRDEESVRRADGFIGFAVELVKSSGEYRFILERLIGNAVVAEDFDSAQRISRQFGNYLRVVTLKGDVFNVGGSITGGANKHLTNGLLSRKGEIDTVKASLTTLRSEADEIQKQLTERLKEKTQLQGEYKIIHDQLAVKDSALSKLEAELRQTEFVLSQAQDRLDALEEANAGGAASGERHEAAMTRTQEALKAKTEEADAAENHVRELEAALSEKTTVLNEAKEAEGRLNIEIAGLKQQKRFMEQSREWEISEIRTLEEEVEKLLSQRKDLLEAEKENEEKTAALTSAITALNQAVEAKEAEIESQKSRVEITDQKREESLEAAEARLKAAAQLEKEEVRLENQLQRAEKDLNDLQDRMWNEYEMTYGTAKELAESGFGNDERLQEAAQLSKTKRHQNITRLRTEIRNLGNVNVGAIEEYQALKDRTEFLTKQRDDIVNSEENLREIIERMTLRMEKQFEEGFRQIAASFNTVFTQMFGGGQAILKLTEGEDSLEAGVEINVQPPGKKLQSMMLLSGGERALTAIALLFSIQQLNPAPFCVLDEIEAALDDANVERFAGYLSEMCDKTQFIVITHRKGTMNVANTMYGVTMEEKGVSKCVSVKFGDDPLGEAE